MEMSRVFPGWRVTHPAGSSPTRASTLILRMTLAAWSVPIADPAEGSAVEKHLHRRPGG